MDSRVPTPLTTTVERIGQLDWREPAGAHRQVAQVFDSVDSEALLANLKDGVDEIVDAERSVEKTTHYKWFISEDTASGFQVWLHEYKSRELRREGHATVPHNHRFWLTSLILRGGFTDTRYRRLRRTAPRTDWISPGSSSSMRAGQTMTLAPEEIHSLSELQEGTISLIVQGRPVSSYSEVFESGSARRYYDLETKLSRLRQSL